MTTSNDIRKRFLDFFAARDHRVVRSSSLVPANDPTLLFSNAGMNQFKDVFLGREKPVSPRACSSQKCVRAGGKHNDLEQVGRTTRHHTFFEMLGNFSFGDYFKKEAIPWAWELITQDFAIPKDKLYATVFREDDEAEELWAKIVACGRIFRLDEKDNFWAMGETGPCGPCSEIHYDLGPEASGLGHKDCKFPCPEDCGRYVEIWNLVFMQFNRDESGKMTPLPRPSIDTGAGLERMATVLQGKISNFDTDLFKPLIDEAAELANKEYGENHDTDVSLRIIADHARAATFLISDGVLPSNEGRGYVLRKIMRRAIDHGRMLGISDHFLFEVAGHVAELMKGPYPELMESTPRVAKIIRVEEEKYASLVEPAVKRFDSHLEARKELMVAQGIADSVNRETGNVIDGNLIPHQKKILVAGFKKFAEGLAEWVRQIRQLDAGLLVSTQGPRPMMDSVVAEMAKELKELNETSELSDEAKQYAIERMTSIGQEILSLFGTMGKPPITGKDLFFAYDTLGLRPDFVRDIAAIHKWAVSGNADEEFGAELERQRERARASWKGAPEPGKYGPKYPQKYGDKYGSKYGPSSALETWQRIAGHLGTIFDGHSQTTAPDCRILALVEGGKSVNEAKPGDEVEIVLDHTPFYAEAGGQVGDVGRFFAHASDQEVAHVEDTYRPVTNFVAHKAVAHETLRVGDAVTAVVDSERRDAIRRNHTATHLLHAALRTELGTHVKQAGSLVAPDRLRFDFSHYAPLGEQDVLDIEDLVNEHVLKNEEVKTDVMDIDSAVNSGAMALFGEKYGDKVRVVSIADGSFSKELCGGTHVRRTGDIGLFKIVTEGSVAAGTRRIEALTGTGVLEQLRKASERLALLAETLRTKPESLLEAVEKLTESEKKLRKQLEAQQMKQAASQAGDLIEQAKDVKGVRVVAARVDVTDRAAMRQMVDSLRPKLGSGVIALGSVADGKVLLIVGVTQDMTSKLDAGKIVREAAKIVEGSGGGRKDLAEAGGKNPEKLDEALAAVPGIVERML